MTPFTTLISIAIPLIRDNVDTDTIIPSREMKSTGKTGLAAGLFAPWRYIDADARTPDPAFVLNDPKYAGAQILLAGKNFGCGSSREHAVWALAEYGFRCIIAQSFAPIFKGNCIRNGILPIECGRPVDPLFRGQIMTIDLANQDMSIPGRFRPFHIDADSKTMLSEGLDAIDLTLKHQHAIAEWQLMDRTKRPWVYRDPPKAKLGEGDHAKHGGGVIRLPEKQNSTVIKARELRRNLSLPEGMLWQELRKRPNNLKFRRQHPAGPYILDFYCPKARLCVEIDGDQHGQDSAIAYDASRDAYLAQHAIATLRIPASAVLKDKYSVINHITSVAAARLPLHHPSDGPPPQSLIGEDL
jgi:3-isopropylmalate/(R)-2-methylmalate dehydratase small subunit